MTSSVALYLAAKRPLDQDRKWSRPIRATIAPPKTSAGIRRACFRYANNQDWSHRIPACCAVAAASTYIRSSANGPNQNPAYSWQLGSKMDGTHLSYG